jgi:hypothetical protein
MPVTDEAWTCPHCNRSYWAPAEWADAPSIWTAARGEAQRIHGIRHRQEVIDSQEQIRVAAPDGAVCTCGHFAVQHGRQRKACLMPGCKCQLLVPSNARR